MKILFLNYEYPPLGGGAANATAALLEEWTKDPALEVHLVTSAVGKKREKIRLGENVFIHRLPIGKNPEKLHAQSLRDIFVYTWKAWLFLFTFIPREQKEKPFDGTLAFFTVPSGFLAYLLRVFFRIPYVVSLRGADVPGYSERFSFLYFFLKPLIRLIWREAMTVVANSVGLRTLAEKTAPRENIEVIPNGIDLERFSPKREQRPKEKIIITSGASRVTKRKGLEYLIEGVAPLIPEHPELLVKILGEGSDRKRLEDLVKKRGLEQNVHFLGRIPRDQTAPYYQEASIFVLPSLNEGMSNAMLEALASGLPIVTTETGGSQELVRAGNNGYLVPARSSEALTEILRLLLISPALRERLGQASRERAEHFSWENVAKEYLEIFQK